MYCSSTCMWAHVLHRACLDALGIDLCLNEKEKIYKDAIVLVAQKYLMEWSSDLESVCSMADVNVEQVIALAKGRFETTDVAKHAAFRQFMRMIHAKYRQTDDRRVRHDPSRVDAAPGEVFA